MWPFYFQYCYRLLLTLLLIKDIFVFSEPLRVTRTPKLLQQIQQWWGLTKKVVGEGSSTSVMSIKPHIKSYISLYYRYFDSGSQKTQLSQLKIMRIMQFSTGRLRSASLPISTENEDSIFFLKSLIISSVLLTHACTAVIWQKAPLGHLHPGCWYGLKASGNFFFTDPQNYQKMKLDNRAHFFFSCGRASFDGRAVFLLQHAESDYHFPWGALWCLFTPGEMRWHLPTPALLKHTGQGRGLAGSTELLFGACASSTYKSS